MDNLLVFYAFTQASTQFLPLETQCHENNTYTQILKNIGPQMKT